MVSIEIIIPKNTKVVPLQNKLLDTEYQDLSHEKEILLNSHTKFKVISYKGNKAVSLPIS